MLWMVLQGNYFNPHTREGCDPGIVSDLIEDLISIHTPVKGVTR